MKLDQFSHSNARPVWMLVFSSRHGCSRVVGFPGLADS